MKIRLLIKLLMVCIGIMILPGCAGDDDYSVSNTSECSHVCDAVHYDHEWAVHYKNLYSDCEKHVKDLKEHHKKCKKKDLHKQIEILQAHINRLSKLNQCLKTACPDAECYGGI